MEPTRVETITRLRNYRDRINDVYSNIDDVTNDIYLLVSVYYGAGSQQERFVNRNIMEYQKTIHGLDDYMSKKKVEGDLRNKMKQFLNTQIQKLEDRQEREDKAYQRNEKQYAQVEPTKSEKSAAQAPSPKPEQSKPFEEYPNEKKHYLIGIGIFWTVSLTLAAGIFSFGIYVGTIKFDKEKIDMAEQLQQLKKDTSIQIKQLREDTARLRASNNVFSLQFQEQFKKIQYLDSLVRTSNKASALKTKSFKETLKDLVRAIDSSQIHK